MNKEKVISRDIVIRVPFPGVLNKSSSHPTATASNKRMWAQLSKWYA